LARASEPNNLFRYTIFNEIGPIASMESLVISKSTSAWLVDGLSVFAFSVVLFALTSTKDAKCIFTWATGNWCLVVDTSLTVCTPVVVAEVVDTTSTIEEETIFACFKGQCSIGTLIKLITVCGVVISLLAVLLCTSSDLRVDDCRLLRWSCQLPPMLWLRSNRLLSTTTTETALLWRRSSES